ncbi:hypothetical protein [Pelagicoccus sp. SDUM812002]|uniref:hypothetical protein n=1 Tax=Pelagicoccus sp. SDUM812002 TaxID=3041266 RepID=UPI0028110AC7|nr:hypothetical protein [Pelagicoccus sp. SDUM812002]
MFSKRIRNHMTVESIRETFVRYEDYRATRHLKCLATKQSIVLLSRHLEFFLQPVEPRM